MPELGHTSLQRIYGTEAVLSRLERLGRHPRTLANLAEAGFPPRQLIEARQWFGESAETPVERYASNIMARGYFEDESLLQLFCRYFECLDWKLESSPWFFSPQEYERFYREITQPVEFQIRQLEQGVGVERWVPVFLRLPPEIALKKAKTTLWEEICQAEHSWQPLRTYAQMRADALFGYLRRTLDVARFSPGRFNYNWEAGFLARLQKTFRAFEARLEETVRIWLEFHRERMKPGSLREDAGRIYPQELLQAFSHLGLTPGAAGMDDLQQAFRRLSKKTHPDQGGTPEEFRRLSRSRELIENWLRRQDHAPEEGPF